VPYNARFWMPGDPSAIAGWKEANGGARNNLFYSFGVGSVHVVMLSSEHALDGPSPQLAWLASDLAAVDRGLFPFVVVGLHRPVYTSTNGNAFPESIGLRESIEPLAIKHRVTAVVAGHCELQRRGRVAGPQPGSFFCLHLQGEGVFWPCLRVSLCRAFPHGRRADKQTTSTSGRAAS